MRKGTSGRKRDKLAKNAANSGGQKSAPPVAPGTALAAATSGTPYSMYIDQSGGTVTSTQYANKPVTATDKTTVVINDIRVFAPNITPLSITNWKDAYVTAINRYYPLRQPLYDIYEYILASEGHLRGIIGKRFDKILNKTLLFKKAGKPVDSMNKLINSVKFRNMCREILNTQMWGISGFEFTPGKDFDCRLIPRKHIKTKWQLITFEQYGNTGVDYTTAANLWVIGEPEDLGALLPACTYAIYKRNALGDWAQYVKIFGQPVRVMHYDAHDPQAKLDLIDVLKNSGGAMEIMIPLGVEFEIMDGNESNGDGKLQLSFVKTMDDSMSIIILGNVESTTSSAVGSHAKAKVQKDEQDDITKNDLFYLTAALNDPHFLNILSDYGYDVEGGEFEHTQEINIEYLLQLIQVWEKLPEDLPISDEDWYSTYGVPKPDNYDELKAAIVEKQKQQQQAGSIAADPKNQPAPTPKPKPKPADQSAAPVPDGYRETSHNEPDIKNLFKAILNFFAHARP